MADEWHQRIENNLRQAKANGRNQVCFVSEKKKEKEKKKNDENKSDGDNVKETDATVGSIGKLPSTLKIAGIVQEDDQIQKHSLEAIQVMYSVLLIVRSCR